MLEGSIIRVYASLVAKGSATKKSRILHQEIQTYKPLLKIFFIDMALYALSYRFVIDTIYKRDLDPSNFTSKFFL